MIFNIVDTRTNRFNVNVDVVLEPSAHDNCVKGSTQADEVDSWICKQLYNTTIKEAIDFANELDGQVTIFLYNPGLDPLGVSKEENEDEGII